MTDKERLTFCKTCHNKKFDFDRGFTCKLTDDKPTFNRTCPSYLEIESEAIIKDRKAFNRKLEEFNFFESNRYPTKGWLIDFFRTRLPQKFEILDSDFDKVILAGVTTLMLSSAFISTGINSWGKGLILLLLITIGVIANLIVWRHFMSSGTTHAVLTNDGINIKDCDPILWEEVSFVYAKGSWMKNSILVKTFKSENPLLIKYDVGIGAWFFVTLIEAYRKNQTGKVSQRY